MALNIPNSPVAVPNDEIAEAGGDVFVRFFARDPDADGFFQARWTIRAGMPYRFSDANGSNPKEFIGPIKKTGFDSEQHTQKLSLQKVAGGFHVMNIFIDVRFFETNAAGQVVQVAGSPVPPIPRVVALTVK